MALINIRLSEELNEKVLEDMKDAPKISKAEFIESKLMRVYGLE